MAININHTFNGIVIQNAYVRIIGFHVQLDGGDRRAPKYIVTADIEFRVSSEAQPYHSTRITLPHGIALEGPLRQAYEALPAALKDEGIGARNV